MLQTTTYKEKPIFFGEDYTKKGIATKVRINYTTYGAIMPGRNFNSSDYRYGYGSHEKVDEVSGSGNTVDMGDRWLDTRLGRTPKMDAKATSYPGISPYAYALNNPIYFKDNDGKVVYDVNGNKVEMYEKDGQLVIANAQSIDPALVSNLMNTYAQSKIGQTTIQELNAEDIHIQVIVSSKVGVFSFEDKEGVHYGVVQGLTTPDASGTYDAKIFIFQPTDGAQVKPDDFDYVDPKTFNLASDQEKANLKNFDQAHFNAKEKSKETQKGLKSLSEADKGTLETIRQESVKDPAFGKATTLIHENVHAQGDQTEKKSYKREIDSYNQKTGGNK